MGQITGPVASTMTLALLIAQAAGVHTAGEGVNLGHGVDQDHREDGNCQAE